MNKPILTNENYYDFLGLVPPKACGECDWCRHEKKIVKPVTLVDILQNGR